MKNARLGFAIVALAAVVPGGAFAAEPLPPPVFVPPPAPAADTTFDWAGLYVGVQGGYGWNSVETDPPAAADFNLDGAALGAYGGFNLQLDSFVFGVDGSVNYSFASGGLPAPFPAGSEGSIDWTTLLRGRAGIALDNVLIYGTAGLAGANLNATIGGVSDSVFAWGWTIGGGVEVGISDSLTGRIDYSYADIDFNLDGFAPDVTGNVQSHTLMGGFSIKY
jgi:outer membrane immunogenic protein